MPINKEKYADLIQKLAESLDISPTKYKQAVDRYDAVGKWLNNGVYTGSVGSEPKIYPQGSFRLGTVVRPLSNGNESEYDIDLVCELQLNKQATTPKHVKNEVGDRLKENDTYKKMIDDEGRRCWTLNYSESDGIGFHLDVLPCVPDALDGKSSTVSLTHKENESYEWTASNPNGYAEWFGNKNRNAFLLLEKYQKSRIVESYISVFDSVDKVPDQLVKTPLQRAIQIMKRHRDLRCDPKTKPISMIITTLAAHLYNGERDVYTALKNIVESLYMHANLLHGKAILDESMANRGLIKRTSNGGWYIGNPVNVNENFADRWHENNHARAKEFFDWVEKIKGDLVDIVDSYDRNGVKNSLRQGLGAAFVDANFNELWPSEPVRTSVPSREVSINRGHKPWRK